MSEMLIIIILAALCLALLAQVVAQQKHSKILFKKYGEEVEKNKQENINQSLLNEISTLRQEKDREVKLRSEAEKQVEIALQQTGEVQKKIDDLKTIQDASLKDAIDSINNVGDDLYDRLSGDYRSENEDLATQIDEKIDEKLGNVYDLLDKINDRLELLSVNGAGAVVQNPNQIISELEKVLKEAHLQSNSDYFARHKLPENVRKSALCEFFIVVNQESAILVDTKSYQFFLDLAQDKSSNLHNSHELFRHKFDRYLSYLTNPKYRSKIIDYFTRNGAVSQGFNNVLIMLVPSQNEVDEFNNLGENYVNILKDNNILLHSLESFRNVIAG